MLYMFLSVLLIVVFFSLCHSVKLFSSQEFLPFILWILLPIVGRSERVTAWFFCCKLRQKTNMWDTAKPCIFLLDFEK